MKTQTTTEQILPIQGYEGSYSISNFGYVISHYKKGTHKILTPGITAQGYPFVVLSNLKLSDASKRTKTTSTFRIHKLMIKTFKKGSKMQDCVNHIDGNKMNNHIDNLEPCTQSYNVNEAIRLNRKPKMSDKCQINKPRPVVVYDPIDDITYTVHSMYRLAKDLDVKICAIYNACNGYQKTVKGLIVRYAD
jgi:hypothetical protein